MTFSAEALAAASAEAAFTTVASGEKTDDIAARGLTLVSASAGSGKTYRLSQEVSSSLAAETGGVVPEGLIAVTYTTKAQAELESRLRRALVERGLHARAESLPLAYLGTVHAVCLQLVKEFALEAGLSPSVDGLPQQAARKLLQESLEWAVPRDLRDDLEEVAERLALNCDARTKRVDWITPIERIMTLARNNRIAPDALPAMAARSSSELLAMLGPPRSDGEQLEGELQREIDHAIKALEQLADGQQNTNSALRTLKDSLIALERGELAWSGWNKLTKVKPGKKALPLVATVTTTAAQYIQHPRLHAEIRRACELVFEVARIGLSAYATWKEQRGLVDYVDMIDHALSLLDIEDVRAELASRLQLLVVDEFQDSSPVQLALFSRLHTLCGRSLWVGDRKQCIFEYAGADPSLMEAVSHWATERGGTTEVLGRNYRSRPELVDLVSRLFSRAFAAHGHSPEEVITTAASSAKFAAELPPLGVWWVNDQREYDAIAEGVQQLLAHPIATPIWDKTSDALRPLRASDVAVLVATNAHAERVAKALAERGIKAALPRTGLMKTPEGTLLVAALRYLADGQDTLACAELEALTGFPEGDREAWFARRVAAHRANDFTVNSNALIALDEVRPRLPQMSPSEVVDQVLATLDFASLAWRWPDPKQRLANLDALRGLVSAYESRAKYLREAASLEGLLRYFDETQVTTKQQDEERASDEQHVVGVGDAVVLSTYHKSKGLEWPVVVLADLNRDKPRDVFDVHPETDRSAFDASDPLGQRWIRYWPWPLGMERKAPLRDLAESSAVGKRLAQRESRERVRLLYVGFTRAKDHLIIAAPINKKGEHRRAWLDELRDAHGTLLELPEPEASVGTVGVLGNQSDSGYFEARVWRLSGTEPVSPPTIDDARFWYASSTSLRTNATASASSEQPPRYVINPSDVVDAGLTLPNARVVSSERLSHRLPFQSPKGRTWDEVGNAIHAFLAADQAHLEQPERHALAQRILAAASLESEFTSDALLAASDALRVYIEDRWPNAKWHREVPIAAVIDTPLGARAVEGTIDLWLETEDGGIVIDHKSFPGASTHWHEQALKHAPQLFTYGLALRTAGHRVLGYFVHFVIGGGIVEVREC